MMPNGFTPEQRLELEQIVESGVRKGFADVGLRVDDGADVDEARKDFGFVRTFRRTLGGWATSIGWFIILSVLGAVVWLLNSGLQFWRGQ